MKFYEILARKTNTVYILIIAVKNIDEYHYYNRYLYYAVCTGNNIRVYVNF